MATLTTKGRLEEAAERRADLLAESRKILDAAQKRDDGLTEAEDKRLTEIKAQVGDIDALKAELERVPDGLFEGVQPPTGGDLSHHFGGTSPKATGPVFKDGDGRLLRAYSGQQPIASRPLGGELGDCIHRILKGDVLNSNVGSTDSAGGYIINPEFSTRFIDLARSASVCMRAGAITLPMQSSELVIAGLATDPTSYWRAETVPVTST